MKNLLAILLTLVFLTGCDETTGSNQQATEAAETVPIKKVVKKAPRKGKLAAQLVDVTSQDWKNHQGRSFRTTKVSIQNTGDFPIRYVKGYFVVYDEAGKKLEKQDYTLYVAQNYEEGIKPGQIQAWASDRGFLLRTASGVAHTSKPFITELHEHSPARHQDEPNKVRIPRDSFSWVAPKAPVVAYTGPTTKATKGGAYFMCTTKEFHNEILGYKNDGDMAAITSAIRSGRCVYSPQNVEVTLLNYNLLTASKYRVTGTTSIVWLDADGVHDIPTADVQEVVGL